jgi:hypothetical protein
LWGWLNKNAYQRIGTDGEILTGSALGAVLNAERVARADQSLASPRCPLWPTGRRWASLWPIRRLSAVTFDAVEPDAEPAVATLRSDNPRAAFPRRVVADVLVVAALQLGHPVPFFVLVVARDRTLHRESPVSVGQTHDIALGS